MRMSRSLCWISLLTVLHAHLVAQGQWQSLDGGVTWEVRSFELSADSSKLFIGGGFPWVGTDSLRANGLASWAGTSWDTSGLGNGNGDTSAAGNYFLPIVSQALFHDTLVIAYLGDYWNYEPGWRSCAYLENDQWHRCGDPENWFFLNDVNGRLFSYG